MTPEQLLQLQMQRAAATGSLIGGGAPAPGIAPTSPEALLSTMGAGYDQLLQQAQANDQMGINPQINAGLDDLKLAQIDASRSILNDPAYMNAQGAAMQNWTYEPTNPYAAKRDALIAMGPQAFIPAAAQTQTRRGIISEGTTPAQIQAAMRDWNRAIDSADFDARSVTRYKTPEELQRDSMGGVLAQVEGGRKAMNGVAPRQMVDPKMVAGQNALLQKSQAGAQGMEAARIKGAADVESARLQAEGVVGAAQAKAESDVTMTKGTRSQLEQEITSNKALQGNLMNMGQTFNPNWFGLTGRARMKYLLGKDYLDLSNPQDKKDIDDWKQFQVQTEQMFNQYRKMITGAAASVQEIERLRQSIFNMDLSPTQARASLLDLMAEMNVKTTLAQATLTRGLASGKKLGIEPGTPAFERYIDNMYNSQDISENKKKIKAALIQAYPQLNPMADDEGGMPKPTMDEIAAEKARRAKAKGSYVPTLPESAQ